MTRLSRTFGLVCIAALSLASMACQGEPQNDAVTAETNVESSVPAVTRQETPAVTQEDTPTVTPPETPTVSPQETPPVTQQDTPAVTPQKAPAPAPAHAGPQVIGFGEPLDIQKYKVEGQVTVFDFTSEYCGPCRVWAPYLERLHHERTDLTVVKVDINRPGVRGIDFRSPLARQYSIRSVPSFKVYNPEGALMAEGRAAQAMLISFIEDLPSLRTQ